MFKTKISTQLRDVIEVSRYAESRREAERIDEDLNRDDNFGGQAREKLYNDNNEFEEKRAISLFKNNRCLKGASKEYYIAWLEGYTATGGEITHTYDYNFPKKMYVVKKDCVITPLYGSAAVEIIVPEFINVEVEDLGNNIVYFMKDFKVEGRSVPVYSDF